MFYYCVWFEWTYISLYYPCYSIIMKFNLKWFSNLKSTFVVIKCITLSAHSTTHSQCQTPKPATAQLILWSHPLIVIIKLCIVNNRKWKTFDFRKPLNDETVIQNWKFHLEIEINLLVLRNVKWPFYDHFCPFFANCMFIFNGPEKAGFDLTHVPARPLAACPVYTWSEAWSFLSKWRRKQ